MSTLYRKYRPQNFLEVVGQNHIKLTLEQEIKTNKIAHAYLFCGPRAVGKTTLARVFAKAINCAERKAETADPCDKCLNCKEIANGNALDVIEIDAASHTGVDNVRENIITTARVAPSRLKYKVFIIDEVHMLSTSAFNALLKIIEEPPVFVIFILCTTEVHKVPATIISRCQRFDFRRISTSDVVKRLNYIIKAEELKIDKSILEEIACYSDGYMRDAESLLGQIVAISGKEITREEASLVIPRSDLNEVINLINFLVKKDAGSGIRLINKLIDDGVDLKRFLNDVIEILRKIMLGKINQGLLEKLSIEFGEAMELKINKISSDITLDQILIYLDKFIKVKNELKNDFMQQLPVELVIVELSNALVYKVSSQSNQMNGGVSVSQFNQRENPFNKSNNSVANNALNKVIDESIVSANATLNVNCEQIADRWDEVLIKIKQRNLSLSFILKVCKPKSLNNNKLCLAFKYKFHRDRVSENNIKVLIEEVLCQTFGAPIAIEAIVDENLEFVINKSIDEESINLKEDGKIVEKKVETEEQGNMLDNLLKTFGGKIIS